MAVSPEYNAGSVSDIGEVELIRRFFEYQHIPKDQDTLGIGDDCAVLNYHEHQKLLVTTDLLAERIHFLKEKGLARDIGYKSVAVNFSDIAAMGGWPTGLFLSLALPPETPVSWLEEFREGLFGLCEQYNVPLLGGDTTGSKQDIIINVMVLGKISSENVKLRSGARDGDILCVTGPLGDSAAGLRLLPDAAGGGLNDEFRSYLTKQHLRPRAALEEGDWLGKETSVHAMMDLSDGLAVDSGHISGRSEIGIDINLNRIPVSDAFEAFVKEQDEDFFDLALNGGEDYHLLCAIAEDDYKDIAGRFEQTFGTPLYRVGNATTGHQGVRYYRDGEPVTFSGTGFNHFKS